VIEEAVVKRLIILLGLVGLILASCRRSSDAPTPLPTAVPPAGELGSWAIGFKHEFPPEFWGEGLHRYAFLIDCPVASDENISSDWQYFRVSEEAQFRSTPVYLRLQGVTTASFSPTYIADAVIHPVQQTIAVVYLVGLSKAAAEQAVSECEAVIFRDDKGAQILTATDPFQP
jgi:hypothetical protein